LFAAGVSLLTGRFNKPTIVVGAAITASLIHGWNTGFFIQQNLSLPVAVTLASYVAGGFLVLLAWTISRAGTREGSFLPFRIAGGVLVLAALLFRVMDYGTWFNGVMAADLAMGFVRLPLVSLILLITALVIRPRRSRVAELLDVPLRRSDVHWVLVVLAFFTVSLGTLRASNPFHTPAAPRGNAAGQILQGVLTNTYSAFNIADEDRLYDRLQESVTDDLIADIYLDSRRKLRSGVRQGAQVTVRAVDVLSVGDAVRGTNAMDGYVYECRWAVTARVSHLQHVHHRQNIYAGTLRIKITDDRWKIDRIALTSEDRSVIPWRSG
jgi:hypothetical protein